MARTGHLPVEALLRRAGPYLLRCARSIARQRTGARLRLSIFARLVAWAFLTARRSCDETDHDSHF